MKFALSAVLLLVCAGAGLSQASKDKVPSDEIWYSALMQTSDGNLKTLRGEARIETSSVIIQADQAILNVDKMDVQATGNVHITLKK